MPPGPAIADDDFFVEGFNDLPPVLRGQFRPSIGILFQNVMKKQPLDVGCAFSNALCAESLYL